MVVEIKKLILVVLGNVFLFFLIFFIEKSLFEVKPSLLNLAVASAMFFVIIIMALFVARSWDYGSNGKILFLTQGLALIRILLSVVWIIIYKEMKEEITPFNLMEFILIYIYYLIIDVYLLDKQVRKSA